MGADDTGTGGNERSSLRAARIVGILDIVVDAIISIDDHQRIRIFNKRAEELFGYRAVEVLGRPLDVLLPETLVDVHRHHVRDFAAAPEMQRKMGDRGEIVGLRKDGTEFRAEASIAKHRFSDGMTFTVVLQEINAGRGAVTAPPELEQPRGDAQQLALEINDNVVQGLVLAQSVLALGWGPERGLEVIDETLARARDLVSDLLGVGPPKPGDLVRSGPADHSPFDEDEP